MDTVQCSTLKSITSFEREKKNSLSQIHSKLCFKSFLESLRCGFQDGRRLQKAVKDIVLRETMTRLVMMHILSERRPKICLAGCAACESTDTVD